MKWNVRLANAAQNQLFNIKDSRIRAQISKRIDALADHPDIQGKSVNEELIEYRSVKTVKERYRIIYKIKKEEIIVLVVMVGIRKEGDKKDVYALAKKLERLGLLDLITLPAPEENDEPEK